MDSGRTHKSAEVQRWLNLQKTERVHVHFTPANSSWLNSMERFFALITGRMIPQERSTARRISERRFINGWRI
jgi:hypothetical protein